jgi:hypothetical protein
MGDTGADVRVRTAEEIARRAAAVTALLLRLNIEMEHRDDAAAGKKLFARLSAWVKDEGLAPHLSARETEVVARKLGKLADGEIFELNWRLQALAALCWAVRKIDPMPPYHHSAAADLIQPAMPMFAPLAPYLACSRRPANAIRRERERAEFWHWRMRTRLLEVQGMKPPAGDTYRACVRRGAEAALERGLIDGLKDGDVDCGGRAYKKLTQEEWADAASTAVERHYALNWACGYADDWDEVRTDT